MTYLAGVHLSHTQSIEALAAASTVVTYVGIISSQRRWLSKADKEAGRITAFPTTFWGRLVTPLHAVATAALPISYLVGVLSNGMRQPEWYTRTSLDLVGVGIDAKEMGYARIAASLGLLGTLWWHERIVRVLGKQLHYIGPRDKGEVVSMGNYAVIRHPIYSLALVQLGILSVAYWSWMPLLSMGICIGAFAYKMTVEEQLMEENQAMGPAYRAYKKKVPYKIIPYIW
ncbi:hypothetical protein GYMLUDRAFT_39851 [Collybiopsis luxurians FD-317 M1]|nr:hypothetical protein GYMLUDRAFT_39851 [Collybiopsis luxurians FD-317 M1]